MSDKTITGSERAFVLWATEIGLITRPAYAHQVSLAKEAFLAGAIWVSEEKQAPAGVCRSCYALPQHWRG